MERQARPREERRAQGAKAGAALRAVADHGGLWRRAALTNLPCHPLLLFALMGAS